MKVQLKGRLVFDKKYIGKGLYVAFWGTGEWNLYPHDELLDAIIAKTNIAVTRSWQEGGMYSFPSPSRQVMQLLAPYKIVGGTKPLVADETA